VLVLITFFVQSFFKDYLVSAGLMPKATYLVTILAVTCFSLGWIFRREQIESEDFNDENSRKSANKNLKC
jgi:hypothetical protein